MKRRAGLAVLALMACCFLVFSLTSGQAAYDIDLSQRLLPPSTEHVFGTDSLGRDLFARVMCGGLISLSAGALVSLISSSLALLLGLCCMTGRTADIVIMRLCDAFKAFPSTLLAILLLVVMGGGMKSIVIALCVVNIPQSTRLVRSKARLLVHLDFVQAKRAMGASRLEILAGTVAKHVIPSLAIQSAFVFSSAVMAEAALSFIGAGLNPAVPSWGNILSEGRSVFYQGWWMIIFPAVFVFLTVLALNLIADSSEEK